uniref:G-protein coupled receptors family 1 profile domain-containing protein n=1 Tax=Ascaris lumbricoides TaxID=6252 RepID=A0A9J2P736_ASCLU
MTVTEEADRGTLSVRITNTEKIISWISKQISIQIALSVTFALVRVRSMRSSFGFLNVSHNIADCLVLTMFVAWFAPMIMIDSNFGHTNFAMRLSQLTGVFMCGSVHSAISIALGRYIALVYPLKYSILFSKRNTIIYAAIAWITGIMQHAPTLFPQCFYYFDFRRYAWIHADTTCGQFLSWFSDLCYGFTMITLVGIPNLATIFQLQRVQSSCYAENRAKIIKTFCFFCGRPLHILVTFMKAEFQKQNDLKSLDANQKRRQVQEWRFFLQAFLTNSLIMLTFIAFHLIKKSMKLRFLHFLTSCLCVILVHGTNRFNFTNIFVYFH